jgi:hypothetical protein
MIGDQVIHATLRLYHEERRSDRPDYLLSKEGNVRTEVTLQIRLVAGFNHSELSMLFYVAKANVVFYPTIEY